MTVVIIGPREERQIARAIERAAANPVRWETMKDVAISNPGLELKLDERRRKPGVVRPESEHLMLGNVRVAYSHEEQPTGMYRHLSASVRKPGKLPHPTAMAMICEAFGFSDAMCGIMRQIQPVTIEGHIWLEEFEPGHSAINVIERIKPQ